MQRGFLKKIELIFSFAIVIGILIIPFFYHDKHVTVLDFSHPVHVADTIVYTAYATTEAQREQGLSGTSPLHIDQGMLFVFDAPVVPGFWMKDMNYPLDIIWIDAEKKIVGVSEELDPKTYPKLFYPPQPVSYVLEVSSGFYKTNLLKGGGSITF